jgi:hypothetical protein
MSASSSQSAASCVDEGGSHRSALAGLLCAALLLAAASVRAQPSGDSPADVGALGRDTPIGRVEYRPGRGLRVGNTGFTLGGFATAEAERLQGGDSSGSFGETHFFLSFDPLPRVHLFTELEIGELATVASDQTGVRSALALGVARAYADFSASDALNLRFGQFLTPIGLWNPVPAEPFVWTTSEPLIVEDVFDDTMTGAMLSGRAFALNGAFSYSLYGTFLDPIKPDPGESPAPKSAGAYLEWASLGGWSVGASYFASEAKTGPWHNLGGIDGLWRPNDRIELSTEAVFGEGTRSNGALWGLYTQAVAETVDTLFAVARYEHFDPPGGGHSINLYDVGLTWIPVYYLRFKVDYSFADHRDELAEPGLRASLSLLF